MLECPVSGRWGSLGGSTPHSTISPMNNGTYHALQELNWNPRMLRKCFAHKDRIVVRSLKPGLRQAGLCCALYCAPHGWLTFEQLCRMDPLTWQPMEFCRRRILPQTNTREPWGLSCLPLVQIFSTGKLLMLILWNSGENQAAPDISFRRLFPTVIRSCHFCRHFSEARLQSGDRI